jgi:hypothetical protein
MTFTISIGFSHLLLLNVFEICMFTNMFAFSVANAFCMSWLNWIVFFYILFNVGTILLPFYKGCNHSSNEFNVRLWFNIFLISLYEWKNTCALYVLHQVEWIKKYATGSLRSCIFCLRFWFCLDKLFKNLI